VVTDGCIGQNHKERREKMIKPHQVLPALLMMHASAWAGSSITGKVTNSKIELTWPSQVNHEYTS